MNEGPAVPAYTTVKLRLASILENLLALTRDQKNDERSHFIQQLLADLAEDTFRLAVFGKYNRGKSTLMNALIGVDRLPTGILPLTSVVTTVRYDSKERVLIQRQGWSFAQEITLEQLPEYVTENGNPGNTKQVTVAEIFLPSDILRYGFFLIDTPGIGSSIRANTEAAEAFIKRSDAAIVVMSVESPLEAEDFDLLERVYRAVGKVFVVLNKADLLSAGEQQRVSQLFSEQVHSRIQEDLPVFILSARNGLLAAKELSGAASPEPGLEKLTEALLAFMARDKTGQFLRRMAERIEELLEQERMEATFAQHATDKKAALETFQKWGRKIKQQGTEIAQELTKQSSSGIYHGLHHLVSEWSKSVVQRFENDPTKEVVSDLVTHLKRSSPLNLDVLVPDYREFLKTLDGLLESLLQQQAELLSADHQQESIENPFTRKFLNRDLTSDIPLTAFEWKSAQHGFMKALLSPWNQEAKRRELISSLDAYSNAFYRKLESAFKQQVENILREFLRREQNLESRMSHLLQQPVDPERAANLKELWTQLNQVKRQVDKSSELTSSDVEDVQRKLRAASQEAKSKGKCALCEHLTKVSFEFMRRYQYRLLTDPAERNRNAERGGMCPFHTWMYESFASPQGICAGYAPVLLHLAERLGAVVQRANWNLSGFEPELRELSRVSNHCLACQIVQSAETERLREIGAAVEHSPELTTLCLPHLCSALLENTEQPGKLEAMENLAGTIRKLGEDMQQFALKHNALRQSSANSSERDAYIRGLMAVAAARPLSFVRKVMELDG